MSDNFFQLFSSVIDASNLSDEDKRFVKAGTWTLEETPEITTVEQYAQYERIIAEVSSLTRQPKCRSRFFGLLMEC